MMFSRARPLWMLNTPFPYWCYYTVVVITGHQVALRSWTSPGVVLLPFLLRVTLWIYSWFLQKLLGFHDDSCGLCSSFGTQFVLPSSVIFHRTVQLIIRIIIIQGNCSILHLREYPLSLIGFYIFHQLLSCYSTPTAECWTLWQLTWSQYIKFIISPITPSPI